MKRNPRPRCAGKDVDHDGKKTRCTLPATKGRAYCNTHNRHPLRKAARYEERATNTGNAPTVAQAFNPPVADRVAPMSAARWTMTPAGPKAGGSVPVNRDAQACRLF